MASTGDRRLAVTIGSGHFAQHVFRILPPVLPLLAVAFPSPLWRLGALASVYVAGSGLAQTPGGVLADRYDRRFVVPPVVALVGVGYLVVALAPPLLAADAAALALAVLATGVSWPALLLGVLVVLGASKWGWTPVRDAITPPAIATAPAPGSRAPRRGRPTRSPPVWSPGRPSARSAPG